MEVTYSYLVYLFSVKIRYLTPVHKRPILSQSLKNPKQNKFVYLTQRKKERLKLYMSKLVVDIDKLHVNINNFHVNIFIPHVNINK